MSSPPASALRVLGKTLGALTLLQLTLPVNAVVTAAALLSSRCRPAGGRRPARAAEPRTILISGGKMTKALQLARSFHSAGHRVVLVETAKYRLTGHRFSNSVDRFHVVPAPDATGYAEALRDIVVRESVDVYVPVCSPVASHYDALAKPLLEPHCEVVHLDVDTLDRVDDKFAFSQLCADIGLNVPDSHRITSAAQVAAFDFAAHPGDYIAKSIAYDPVRRLDLTRLPRPTQEETGRFAAALPVSESTPWILQQFVRGREFCTHSTVRNGELTLFCCCESSAFQVNYEMVEHPGIEAWVRHFAGALKLTGQVSFDFMETDDGEVYAIECNPRTHSAITLFHDHPGVAAAYLADGGAPVVKPLPGSRPTYWLYHELWRALRRPRQAAQRLEVVRRGRDAVFDRADPLPFFMLHHVHIPLLLLGNLRDLRPWNKIDFNIGKLVEPAGD